MRHGRDITMSLAYALLTLAWVVSVGGSFLVPWSFQHKHRAIFAILLGLMLSGVGWYETLHYEKPPSAQDIAHELAKLVPLRPPQVPDQPDQKGPERRCSARWGTWEARPWQPQTRS